MNMVELSKENVEKVFEAIELAKSSGKIKKGSNEVTKALERGNAKLVITSKDVSPPEIIMHIPLLAKEKEVPFAQVDSKTELGAAAGLTKGTAAVAIVDEGGAKDLIKELKESLK